MSPMISHIPTKEQVYAAKQDGRSPGSLELLSSSGCSDPEDSDANNQAQMQSFLDSFVHCQDEASIRNSQVLSLESTAKYRDGATNPKKDKCTSKRSTSIRRRSSLSEGDRERVGSMALKYVKDYQRRSSFRDATKEQMVRPVQVDDVTIGKLLGTGTFNNVYQASIRSNSSSGVDRKEETRHGGGDCTYALKQLKLQVMDDRNDYATGAIDLALEAKLLSSMNHENIVKIHGITAGCISEAFSSGLEGNYFLVLDRMLCSLKDRIQSWRAQEENNKMSWVRRLGATSRNKMLYMHDRLRVAFEISRGLRYLHSNNIVYRDLKPDNIGFDAACKVKIFDFGLARELLPNEDKRPTGMTGSPRYMAPEVARNMHYGLSADTYSFGVLLWEICALEKPFESHLKNKAFSWNKDIVYGNKRPKLKRSWKRGLKILMRDCWADDASQRPEMKRVAKKLVAEMSTMGGGKATGGKSSLPTSSELTCELTRHENDMA